MNEYMLNLVGVRITLDLASVRLIRALLYEVEVDLREEAKRE